MPSPPPLISILMPLRNAQPYLAEALQSIMAQSYPHWEAILINDHSTDNTASMARLFAECDARIRVYPARGRGILPALQQALPLAQGEAISRMDGDDCMPAVRLAQMMQSLQATTRPSIVTGMVRYFGSQPISRGYRRYERWLNDTLQAGQPWRRIYRECVIASPNWLIWRRDLLACGGFSGLRYPEDYGLALRWYAAAYQVVALEQITLHWREHPARTSRRSAHYAQRAFFELKIPRFLELDYRGGPLILWGTGRKAKITAQILLRRQVAFRWVALHPEWYPQGIYGKKLEHYSLVSHMPQAQLLIAVYPPEAARRQMTNYLSNNGFIEGDNYWFL